jgi:hypothetical protein
VLILAALALLPIMGAVWLIVDVVCRPDRKRSRFVGAAGGVLGALIYAALAHGADVLPVAVQVIAGLTVAALWLFVFIQTGQRRPVRRLVVAGIPLTLAAAAWIFLPGWLAGRHEEAYYALLDTCEDARRLPTLDARREALEGARRRLAELARHVARGSSRCRLLEEELTALREKGACPETLLAGQACACGDKRWPDDAPCLEAYCGRDTPEGYVANPYDYPRILKCRSAPARR